MQKLRRLHLYLGCFFAPMLIFFAISGLWQTLRIRDESGILDTLSTIHTGREFKGGGALSSPYLKLFIMLMALGLIFSIATGVVMAFKFGRARTTFYSLVGGIAVPLALIVWFRR